MQTPRLWVDVGLLLLIATLIFHLVAMAYPRWKIYEHRRTPFKTMSVGIFQRCENEAIAIGTSNNKTQFVCYDNTYFTRQNACEQTTLGLSVESVQRLCNLKNETYSCDYSSIGKGLISCTIISACTLGLAFLLTFAHLFINEFKYKTHLCLAIIAIVFLILAFSFLLATLILLGSTMAYDVHQYRYNLDCRLQNDAANSDIKNIIFNQTSIDYSIRIDWAGALEIIALVLSCFTLLSQIFYLFSTHRNRIG